MTYPPPGGQNPQYQLQPEPQQPSDPYAQGYGNTPPPPSPGQYPSPGQFTQPQYTQPPSQPMMPPVGVQPGYPSAPGSVLPPPVPPAQSGGNLLVILGVVVGLVVVLGIAAVLIIPGMLGDDEDPQAGGGDDPTTSEESSEEPTQEETEAAPTEDETEDTGGTLEGWGTPVSSEDDFDPDSPVGVAISYQLAWYADDDAALEALVSKNATDDMIWDLEYKLEDDTTYDFVIWGVKREGDGDVQAWAGWTWDDLAPDSEDDLALSYTYTLVEEDGAWKLQDVVFGAP